MQGQIKSSMQSYSTQAGFKSAPWVFSLFHNARVKSDPPYRLTLLDAGNHSKANLGPVAKVLLGCRDVSCRLQDILAGRQDNLLAHSPPLQELLEQIQHVGDAVRHGAANVIKSAASMKDDTETNSAKLLLQ